jgi:Icc protein
VVTAVLASVLVAGLEVAGVAFADTNANGRRDQGEAGLPGVVVTDGAAVVRTAADGGYALSSVTARHVFVVTPGDRRVVGSWYRAPAARVDFALARAAVPARWCFAHLSDPHVDVGAADTLRAALARAAAEGALFAVVSGDLVQNAPAADEARARALFASYGRVARAAPLPLRPALGNHDLAGIDRAPSHAAAGRFGYGKALYEIEQGPRYSAFHRGRVHFVVLDTVGIEDQRYFGELDAAQLEWIRRELAHVPPGTAVVTVGHIPLRSGALSLGYAAEGLARRMLGKDGRSSRRHLVANAGALAEILRPYRWTLALQGHTHVAERLPPAAGGLTRHHTAPALASRSEAGQAPGFFLYAVDGDRIDDGRLVLLPPPAGQGAGE